jgi:hypothetical protein
LNFVPTRNSFSGFDHQYTAMFRQGVHDNMRTQMNTQDIHTNMLRQQQQWMDQAGKRLEDTEETAGANAELLARRFQQWGCRIKQLGGDTPKVSITIYFYILSIV